MKCRHTRAAGAICACALGSMYNRQPPAPLSKACAECILWCNLGQACLRAPLTAASLATTGTAWHGLSQAPQAANQDPGNDTRDNSSMRSYTILELEKNMASGGDQPNPTHSGRTF
jgi:hypothetical protein